jgi:hypothetical protein
MNVLLLLLLLLPPRKSNIDRGRQRSSNNEVYYLKLMTAAPLLRLAGSLNGCSQPPTGRGSESTPCQNVCRSARFIEWWAANVGHVTEVGGASSGRHQLWFVGIGSLDEQLPLTWQLRHVIRQSTAVVLNFIELITPHLYVPPPTDTSPPSISLSLSSNMLMTAGFQDESRLTANIKILSTLWVC